MGLRKGKEKGPRKGKEKGKVSERNERRQKGRGKEGKGRDGTPNFKNVVSPLLSTEKRDITSRNISVNGRTHDREA